MVRNKIILASSLSIFGFIAGIFVGSELSKSKINTCGNLRIDSSEADEPPKMFLEVVDSNALNKSDYVIFKVVRENYISHKN